MGSEVVRGRMCISLRRPDNAEQILDAEMNRVGELKKSVEWRLYGRSQLTISYPRGERAWVEGKRWSLTRATSGWKRAGRQGRAFC
jgi:hypothetical protein